MKKLSFFTLLMLSFSLSSQKNTPKIIVGIVIDQMCYDYLYRFQNNFSENGFKKLMRKGSHLKNMHYNYIPTYTGPGHASIYTGATPKVHGIIANSWIEESSKSIVNCVGDPSVVGIESSILYGKSSPHRLNTSTITDQLKNEHPKSKVISISIKDRGAILPGGFKSDGSYWFDYGKGQFITSSYYLSQMPKWVRKFNAKNNALSYSQVWKPLLAKESYSAIDSSPYEKVINGQGTAVFPYDIKNLCSLNQSYEPFTMSPFANNLLTDLAIEALKKENLGKGEFTDMLCISYSSTDIAGHLFGPDSKEIEDMYYRLDLELSRLLNHLEKSFGKDEFVLFLTADHGVATVPQKRVDEGLSGGYVFIDRVISDLRNRSITLFGVDFILGQNNLNIYLNQEVLDSILPKVSKNLLLTQLEEELSKVKGIKTTRRGVSLRSQNKNDDKWDRLLANGFDPNRSGDLLIVLESGYLPKSSIDAHHAQGTSHGSGYNYDTHVPCIWYGAGIKSQEIIAPLNITDIAPTLREILNLPKTGQMTGKPIEAILKR